MTAFMLSMVEIVCIIMYMGGRPYKNSGNTATGKNILEQNLSFRCRIKPLVNLQQLFVRGNNLSEAPLSEYFTELKSLKVLDMRNCRLKNLPVWYVCIYSILLIFNGLKIHYRKRFVAQRSVIECFSKSFV